MPQILPSFQQDEPPVATKLSAPIGSVDERPSVTTVSRHTEADNACRRVRSLLTHQEGDSHHNVRLTHAHEPRRIGAQVVHHSVAVGSMRRLGCASRV